MDPFRCVVFEFNGANQEKQILLRYLEKNDQIYNWIVTELDKIRACIWWSGNMQFSVTPLRSFLKRLKRKMSDLEISRKMSTRDGVMRVFDGNVPVLSNVNVLHRNSIFHLIKPVREHVLRLRLEQYKRIKKSPPEEPTSLEDSPHTVSDEEFKRYKYKVNLLAKVTARIADEVKELSQRLQSIESTEPVEVKENTSSPMITDTKQPEVTEVLEKPTSKKSGILEYCNRDPFTGECDGDPRGHMHPF